MPNDLQTADEPRLSTLVTGIVNDVRELVKQQLALFRAEVVSDLRKTRQASIPLVIGLVVLVLGVLLLSHMLALLLYFATAWPFWVCYGVVGLVLVIVGGGLAYAGKKKFDSFNPLPDESAEALKENIQCLMNPK
jgi:hypothetical protein